MDTITYRKVRGLLNKNAGQSLTIEDFTAMTTKQKQSTLKKLIEITELKESNLRDFGMIRKSYALTKLKKNQGIKSIEDIAKLTPNQMTREANIILQFIASESSTPLGIITREKQISKMADGYSNLSSHSQKRFWNLADRLRDTGLISNIYGDIGSDVQVALTFEFFNIAKNDDTVKDWSEYTNDELEDIVREKMHMPLSDGQRALRMARATGTPRKSALKAMGFTGKRHR